MSFNPRFKYKPLLNSTSIRVLLINPGKADDEIHCQFLPCDLNADHDTFPEYPRPREVMSIGKNIATGQTFFMKCNIICDDDPNADDQRLHPFQRYEALSYVWGHASDMQIMKLENEDFIVTRNLMAALKTVRRPKEAVKFWIDAICVNQADLEEKKTQIPLMGRIYQQAKCVCAQVLPSFDKTDSLRELIVAIGTAGMALEKDLRAREPIEEQTTREVNGRIERLVPERSNSLLFTKHALEDYDLPSETSPLWQSWREIFASPFFRRIWVQQEVVLARKLNFFMGNTLIDHHVLFTCMEIMQRYSRELRGAYFRPEGVPVPLQVFVVTEDSLPSFKAPVPLDFDAAHGIQSGFLAAWRMLNEREEAESSRTDRHLIDLLADYQNFCATEPRDMIFGLLGLAKDAEHFHDLVDYSMPLRTLFVSLAQRLTDLGHSAKVLLQAANTANTEDLPSWVPNWSPLVVPPSVTHHRSSPILTKDFCAGGEDIKNGLEIIQDACHPQRPTLRVRGALVDTIKQCSLAARAEELTPWVQETHTLSPPVALRDGGMSISLTFALHGLRFAAKHVPREQGPGSLAFLEVCCQAARDFWEDGSSHSIRLAFFQVLSMYTGDLSFLEQARGRFDTKDEMLPMKDFFNEVLEPLGLQRRFCTTELGLFGVVPFDCKPGDKVFVLRGGVVPLILRPVASHLNAEDKGQRYQLIGDAYIRGVMYGEGLSFDEVQESDFVLL